MFVASADQCFSRFHLKMSRLNHHSLDQRGNWTTVLDSRPMNYCWRASYPGTVSCFKCMVNEVADGLSLPQKQFLQRSQGRAVAIGNGISPESESWQINKKKQYVWSDRRSGRLTAQQTIQFRIYLSCCSLHINSETLNACAHKNTKSQMLLIKTFSRYWKKST